MKMKLLSITFASFILSLSSCGFPRPYSGGPDGNGQGQSGEVIPYSDASQDNVDVEGVVSTYIDPNLNPDTKPSSGTTTINIVAINDFHGQINEDIHSIGIEKIGSYFLDKSMTENTLIIDSGDTWQGSIYSNYNHGKLITDVYNYAHVHARTIGNHDFDWGITKLQENAAKESWGYKTPVLGANIYDFDFATKTEGTIQQSQLGISSVSYTLKNGLKVGIVGVIGKDQITSITSSYVQDICFINHINVIKEEAANLRSSGCDVVIASCHTGQEDVLNNNLKDNVDLVLCGHTHQDQIEQEDNLVFAQFACNGEMVGDIELTYNYATNKVTNTVINKKAINDFKNQSIDSNIHKIVTAYNESCSAAADTVVASDAEYFAKNEEAPNLMAKAIFDETVREKQDVILSMSNISRAYLPKGTWKYSHLYESFPFDNIINIIEVSGKDIYNEARYNNIYINPTFDGRLVRNQKYKIAVIDYLAYHTSTDRDYDYFSSFSGTPIASLTNCYRIILRDWLIRCGFNQNIYHLSSIYYSSDISSYNSSFLRLTY